MLNRYVQTITIFTYGETPEEAFNAGQKICDQVNALEPSAEAEIEKMAQRNYGTLDAKDFDVKELKQKCYGN